MDVRIGNLTVGTAAVRSTRVLDVRCSSQKMKKMNHIIRGKTRIEIRILWEMKPDRLKMTEELVRQYENKEISSYQLNTNLKYIIWSRK
jgi:hypothetical protein